ncbi:hypothetical protein RCG67_11195 [Kocuria sp. CPCC 205292]|uniref:hypothetical protein n=1 Tax=Kocuria cellulosilytica TaxID=3071451 RepID=UPI0034D411C9
MPAHDRGPEDDALPARTEAPEEHSPATALRLIGVFEQRCGAGRAQVSTVRFDGDRTELQLSSGQELSFPHLRPLQDFLAARAREAREAVSTTGRPSGAEERAQWEWWYEVLLDLAAYPSYFEDLHPRLEVLAVHRSPHAAVITVGDGRITETYRVSRAPEDQFPLGIPDDIRYSFDNAAAKEPPFAKRVR